MNIIIVDDEPISLEVLKINVEKATPTSKVMIFDNEIDAYDYTRHNQVDVAFLDIHLKGSSLGTDLAKKIQKKYPRVNIIFVTSDPQFKAEALDLKVSGYLVKPIDIKKIKKELAELRYPISEENKLLKIQCFGNFSVFTISGNPVKFSRSKSKEVLAYLVCKKGTAVTTKELEAILFEDDEYDVKKQHYVNQLVYSLTKDLKSIGAEDIIVKTANSISLDTSLVNCDYYRFNEDDEAAKKQYTGEFMVQYEWADYIAGYLDRAFYDE